MDLIFSDASLAVTPGIIDVLNKDFLGDIFHLMSNKHSVRLIWQTFYQEVSLDYSARGFRILAYGAGNAISNVILYTIDRAA